MNNIPSNIDDVERKTRSAYLWTQVLNTPIWALFNILQYIIYKDLNATALQITIVITLKPLVSLFSVYWGAYVENRRDRLVSNIIGARILSTVPFFFFPFVDNIWFFIASFGIFMMLARGSVPAWMEILKLNTPQNSRAKLFGFGALIGHSGNCLFPFIIGSILDGYYQSWRWLFPITALISLASILLQRRIPVDLSSCLSNEEKVSQIKQSFSQMLIAPWKSGIELMKRRKDFTKFQFGFMLGGAGMMIAHPVLPQFFVDVLNLSYTEMSLAVNCCKGIGFILATPLWANYLNKTNIYRFSALPPIYICLFSGFLLLSQFNIIWLFVAYFFYGITQAGGDLSWNLSGTIFSKSEESPAFSNVNILTVGIRGCIIPPLGSLLCLTISAPFVIAFGGFLSLLSNRALMNYSAELNKKSPSEPIQEL